MNKRNGNWDQMGAASGLLATSLFVRVVQKSSDDDFDGL